MKEIKNIDYIFFDIGYTLVNEDAVWIERCKEQAATDEAQKLGVTVDILMHDIICASDMYLSPWKSVISKYGFTYSAKYKSEFETLYDDTVAVLQQLSRRFKLGIIANQNGNLSKRLNSWGITKYFSTIISSADYGVSKPDKRLFVAALEKSGCAAQHAVIVGDRLDNDIAPANELGLTTIRIKQGLAKSQIARAEIYKSVFEINNLTELLYLPFLNK